MRPGARPPSSRANTNRAWSAAQAMRLLARHVLAARHVGLRVDHGAVAAALVAIHVVFLTVGGLQLVVPPASRELVPALAAGQGVAARAAANDVRTPASA